MDEVFDAGVAVHAIEHCSGRNFERRSWETTSETVFPSTMRVVVGSRWQSRQSEFLKRFRGDSRPPGQRDGRKQAKQVEVATRLTPTAKRDRRKCRFYSVPS